MTEEDVKQKIITPAIKKSGWNDNQINYEYAFTDGRFMLKGKDVVRDKPKKADYLLSYKSNIPLAVIEAKSDKYNLGYGIQKVLIMLKCLICLLHIAQMVLVF